MDKIIVKGARENNLKNVNIELPKNKMRLSEFQTGAIVCVTNLLFSDLYSAVILFCKIT